MSFVIKLQTCNDKKIKIGKSPTTVLSLDGTLKVQTSIIDPTIIIESSDAVNLLKCNYITIPSFNRSYFISDIKSVSNKLWEIYAHVDVLDSFKNEILANTAIIARQEKEWNLYLDDGTFKSYQNPLVMTQTFPQGFNSQEFILITAGGFEESV